MLFQFPGAVTKHTEEWNHEHHSSAEDGTFIGKLAEWRKTAFAGATNMFVSQTPPGEQGAQ